MRIFAFALGLGFTAPAMAEVIEVAPNGMEIKEVARIAAPPEKVWAAIIQPARWWSSDHTFSGASSNMSFEAKVGGCWCETLPNGGGVVHMTVAHIAPPKTLVLRGALGPFYNLAADGAMTYALTASGAETEVILTFRSGGYVKGGFETWAPAVDTVLGQQMARLKAYLEAAK